MAQAALEDSMSEQAAPSVAFIITRNGDPFTLALRNGYDLSNDDLLQLSQASSSASTSVGSSPTAVFSSREPSNVTKPTSYGTSYPAHDYNGEGKVDTMYAASLSATHGSESEAEVEYDDARCIALLGTGAWSSGTQTHGSCLRKLENAKIRSSKIRLSKALPHRLKKPSIVLHQDATSACQDEEQPPTAAPAQMGAGPMCSRHHIPGQHYALLGLVVLILLTIFLSGLKIYYTDRVDIMSLKCNVTATTSLVAFEMIVTTLVAGRTLVEASLLGLFPLIIGSMFLMTAG